MCQKNDDALRKQTEVDVAIAQAEAECAATGILLDGRETLAKLREKHFGKQTNNNTG